MNDLITKIEQMQAEAREGMKRASRDSDPYLYQYLVGKFHAFGKVAGMLKKQMKIMTTRITDSEDERIRKFLVDYFVSYKIDNVTTKLNGVRIDDILAYLEKQKEQKPDFIVPKRIHPKFAVGDTVCRPMWSDHTIREIYIDCNDPVYICVNDEGLESHISFSEQDEWKRKEQKPVQTDDEKEYVRTLKSLISDFLRGKEDVDREYYQQIFDWLDGRHIEQKPAEWSEEDEKLIDDVINSLCCYQNTLSDYQKEIVGEEIRKLKSLKPQPKPEVEGDNETEIQKAYREGKNAGRKEVFDHPEEYGLQLRRMYDYETGRRNPEWSEEDKRILKGIIGLIDHNQHYGVGNKEMLAWLKSIRPQQKQEWSEEDGLHYANVLEALEYVKGCKSDYDKIEAVKSDISWLKLLRNRVGKDSLQPHWKPSEEQIYSLGTVVKGAGENSVGSVAYNLKELYEQLKRLKEDEQ